MPIEYPSLKKTDMEEKIFVTGAAGFIGFHAASKLRSLGADVLGYDNFNAYYEVSLKEARCKHLLSAGIPIVHGDISNLNELKTHVKKYQPTHILHLAAQAGVRYSLENPDAYVRSNVNGFLNILEICRSMPHIKLTYASSSSVYGLNTKVPFSEGDRTDEQASLYGVTKKCNELAAATYKHLFGLKSVGLRFFTVYGPWGRPDMAYYSFTRNILNNKPIAVFNNGQMRRDFTYIDDIIEGIVAALSYNGDESLFNLGNNHPEQLGKMISILEALLGRKANKEYLPMQQGDVVETYADIQRSSRELGFKPKTSLEEGLAKFVDWYLSYNKN